MCTVEYRTVPLKLLFRGYVHSRGFRFKEEFSCRLHNYEGGLKIKSRFRLQQSFVRGRFNFFSLVSLFARPPRIIEKNDFVTRDSEISILGVFFLAILFRRITAPFKQS